MPKKQPAISSKWAPRIAALFATAGAVAGLVTLWPTISLALFESAPPIVSAGSIMQGGSYVGFGVGARRDKYDLTRLDFTEITNANRFDFNKEFYYESHRLKLSKVFLVRDATSEGGRKLEGVTATIIRQK
jgi:hypothetical protein